jgi:superfamily II DNA/RNA helicase
MGSSVYAGLRTAERLLETWEGEIAEEDEEEITSPGYEDEEPTPSGMARALTDAERDTLQRFISALRANQERDPKLAIVLRVLRDDGWLDRGCIVFSQYRESIQWLAEQMTQELGDETIALYSGPTSSGTMHDGSWTSRSREELKALVRRGELRLMLGTDAASEGLNLQRLATLINLDLPWNPTRLEQRKGRIQRIGQVHETVHIYNMRYRGSVEDRVHQLLSSRLQGIYGMFGQIPDVLEDVWVAMALGEKEKAQRIIDAVPKEHPFEVRYSRVEKVDWETCQLVLDARERRRVLSSGW